MIARIDTSPEAVALMLEGVTPGPWAAFIDDSGGQWSGWPLSVDAINLTDKTIVRPGGHWPYEWDAKTSQGEAVANARFIAWAREAVPALAAERDAALAREAKLREALLNIDALDPEGMADGCSPDALRGLVNRMGQIARAALQDAAK